MGTCTTVCLSSETESCTIHSKQANGMILINLASTHRRNHARIYETTSRPRTFARIRVQEYGLSGIVCGTTVVPIFHRDTRFRENVIGGQVTRSSDQENRLAKAKRTFPLTAELLPLVLGNHLERKNDKLCQGKY